MQEQPIYGSLFSCSGSSNHDPFDCVIAVAIRQLGNDSSLHSSCPLSKLLLDMAYLQGAGAGVPWSADNWATREGRARQLGMPSGFRPGS